MIDICLRRHHDTIAGSFTESISQPVNDATQRP